MIMKALLAWAGLKAVPHIHDIRVHDALNEDTAAIAGFRIVARQSLKASEAMASDPTNEPRFRKGVDDMRATLAVVARRADR